MPQIVAAERPVHKFGSYSQHTVLHDHSRAALILQHSPRLTGLKTCAPRGRLTSSGPFSPTMASPLGAELVPLANMGMERPPAPAPRAAPDHVGTLLEPALPPSPSNEPNRFRSSASSTQKDGLGHYWTRRWRKGARSTSLNRSSFPPAPRTIYGPIHG